MHINNFSYCLIIYGSEDICRQAVRVLSELEIEKGIAVIGDNHAVFDSGQISAYDGNCVSFRNTSAAEWNETALENILHNAALQVSDAIIILEYCDKRDKTYGIRKRFQNDFFQEKHSEIIMPYFDKDGDIPFDKRFDLTLQKPNFNYTSLTEQCNSDMLMLDLGFAKLAALIIQDSMEKGIAIGLIDSDENWQDITDIKNKSHIHNGVFQFDEEIEVLVYGDKNSETVTHKVSIGVCKPDESTRSVAELISQKVSREVMSVEEEREYIAHLYKEYRKTGILDIFYSPYDFAAPFSGKKFSVIEEIKEGPYHTLSSLPMWRIKFDSGEELEAYPEEICYTERKKRFIDFYVRLSQKEYLHEIIVKAETAGMAEIIAKEHFPNEMMLELRPAGKKDLDRNLSVYSYPKMRNKRQIKNKSDSKIKKS